MTVSSFQLKIKNFSVFCIVNSFCGERTAKSIGTHLETAEQTGQGVSPIEEASKYNQKGKDLQMQFLKYFKNEQGQGMSEYLILILLIAVASITVSQQVGRTVYGKLRDVNTSLRTVTLESVRGGGDAQR